MVGQYALVSTVASQEGAKFSEDPGRTAWSPKTCKLAVLAALNCP